ncbi:MAG: SGNH/GDSL hydrolase family protein [Desulfobacterota bacterium]|jgi:lysophospholipase L1-like esterase|nr:SGNH/GDSL hydrolase family protein [Thermodesulfobacteriota bacterium]
MSLKPATAVFLLMACNLVVNVPFLAEHVSIGFRLAPYRYVVYVFHGLTILAALFVLYRHASIRITRFHLFLAVVVLACLEITPYLANVYFKIRFRAEPSEFIARNTQDQYVPFVNAPGAFVQKQGYTIQINSRGFRDREYDWTGLLESKNIIFIGDSVTFGSGVNLDDTFVKVVERGLDGIFCLNWGVAGYDLLDNVGNLSHLDFRKYKPRMVVFSYCVNDFSSASRTYDEKVGLMSNLDIYCPHNILLKALKGGTSRFLEKKLAEVVEMCKQEGVGLVINILPAKYPDDKRNEVFLMAYDFVKGFVVRHQVPYIDAQYLMNDSRYFIDDIHLSVEGHKRMGDLILSYLKETK